MKRGYIVIDQSLCKGCGLCVEVCPHQLIDFSDKLNIRGYFPAEFKGGEGNPQGCTGCTLCGIVCPEVAIEVYRG